MDKLSNFIYSGLFIVLLGFGDDNSRLISNEIVLISGGLALGYGLILQMKSGNKIEPTKSPDKFEWTKLSPKNYILIGIIIARLNRIFPFLGKYSDWEIIISSIGLIIAFYGTYLFLQEKRKRKESGNIE